jgi:hypothetical protein
MRHLGFVEMAPFVTQADSAVHAGMLDLNVSPFKRTWQKVEQEIGLLEID